MGGGAQQSIRKWPWALSCHSEQVAQATMVPPGKLLNLFKPWFSHLFRCFHFSHLVWPGKSCKRAVRSKSAGSALRWTSFSWGLAGAGLPMHCTSQTERGYSWIWLQIDYLSGALQRIVTTFRVCWPLGINMSTACWELARTRRRWKRPDRSWWSQQSCYFNWGWLANCWASQGQAEDTRPMRNRDFSWR